MLNPNLELLTRLSKSRRNKYVNLPVMPYVSQQKPETDEKLSPNDIKGLAFEKFVVQLFDRQHFTLLEWRSDKRVDGISPFMSKFPDFEFFLKTESESCHFAVECKWREYFYKECIELDESQLNNYREFEKVTGILTFIVLGIGGSPTRPNEMYIMKLTDVTKSILPAMSLIPFKRKNAYDNFYLKCKEQVLQ